MMPLTVPTQITIVRILIVPFFIASVLYYNPQNDHLRSWALFLFLFAIILDAVDGYIARKFNQTSRLGAILDPIADKLLLISGFVCLYKAGETYGIVQFPIWLIVIVISRDVILLLGGLIIHLIHGDLKVNPSPWGKFNTGLQAACIIGVLIFFKYNEIIWYATAVVSVGSLLGYIQKEVEVLNANNT